MLCILKFCKNFNKTHDYHDSIDKIWNQSENVYKSYEILGTRYKHVLNEQLIYSTNSRLKRTDTNKN